MLTDQFKPADSIYMVCQLWPFGDGRQADSPKNCFACLFSFRSVDVVECDGNM